MHLFNNTFTENLAPRWDAAGVGGGLEAVGTARLH